MKLWNNFFVWKLFIFRNKNWGVLDKDKHIIDFLNALSPNDRMM